MKKLLLTLFFAGLSFVALQAQNYSVSVTEEDQMVNKINRTGLSINLNLQKKDVKDAWKKQLKEYGKVDSHGDEFVVEQATIPSISSRTVRIVSVVISSGKGVKVWWGIDMGDKWVTKNGTGYSAAEKVLKDFGLKAYKEDIQEQIDDAEKAWEKAVKDHEKSIKDGEKLQSDLKNNADEKVKLENDLKKNAEEKVQLEKDVVQNKKDQEAMTQEVATKKKAVEAVKAKLNMVK